MEPDLPILGVRGGVGRDVVPLIGVHPLSAPAFSPLPSERVIHQALFSPRLILKHLKVTVILTNRRVYMSEPHTLFGVIPHGGYANSVPLDAVSDVSVGNETSTRRMMTGGVAMVFGLFFALIGLQFGRASGPEGFFGGLIVFLLFVIVGVVIIISARSLALRVRSFGGLSSFAPAGSSERAQLEILAQMILAQMLEARSEAAASGAASPAGTDPQPSPPLPPAPPVPPVPPSPPAPLSPPAGRPTGRSPQTAGWTPATGRTTGPSTHSSPSPDTSGHGTREANATEFIPRPGASSSDAARPAPGWPPER